MQLKLLPRKVSSRQYYGFIMRPSERLEMGPSAVIAERLAGHISFQIFVDDNYIGLKMLKTDKGEEEARKITRVGDRSPSYEFNISAALRYHGIKKIAKPARIPFIKSPEDETLYLIDMREFKQKNVQILTFLEEGSLKCF
jgi:hypothetical protein